MQLIPPIQINIRDNDYSDNQSIDIAIGCTDLRFCVFTNEQKLGIINALICKYLAELLTEGCDLKYSDEFFDSLVIIGKHAIYCTFRPWGIILPTIEEQARAMSIILNDDDFIADLSTEFENAFKPIVDEAIKSGRLKVSPTP